MKYIVLQFKDELGRTVEYPIIFPEGIIHAEMADVVKHAIRRSQGRITIPTAVAAGEVFIDEVCIGKSRSESLNRGPRHGDDTFIEMIDETKGVIRDHD